MENVALDGHREEEWWRVPLTTIEVDAARVLGGVMVPLVASAG